MNELQLSLLDWNVVETPAGQGSIEDRAEAFHRTNPHVFQALRDLSLGIKRRGRTKWSINGAFEVLRWSVAMQTSGDDFKLNNNYRAYYARLLMTMCPELDGFFDTRSAGDGHD